MPYGLPAEYSPLLPAQILCPEQVAPEKTDALYLDQPATSDVLLWLFQTIEVGHRRSGRRCKRLPDRNQRSSPSASLPRDLPPQLRCQYGHRLPAQTILPEQFQIGMHFIQTVKAWIGGHCKYCYQLIRLSHSRRSIRPEPVWASEFLIREGLIGGQETVYHQQEEFLHCTKSFLRKSAIPRL